MTRIRSDYVFGTLSTGGGISAIATTFDAAELTRLPPVVAPDIAAITLHDSSIGLYEIVHVTAHVAGATSATIVRGQEGSTARVWAAGAMWLHAPTVTDLRFVGAKMYRNAAYNLVAGAVTVMPWDAEEYDTDGFHDDAVNPSRFTVPAGMSGMYRLSANVGTSTTNNPPRFILSLRKNGTVIRGGNVEHAYAGTTYPMVHVTVDVALADGDYVDAAYFTSTGTPTFNTAQCAMSIYGLS